MKRWLSIVGLLAAAWLFAAAPAAAQVGPRYWRSNPTFSPWLDLFQRDGGPLDNYHTFVRPRVRLNDTLTQQRRAIQRQDASLRALGQQVTRLEQGPVRPTGAASSFMNYSHYYQLGSRGGGAQRR